ncbi:MAG: fibrobacter succinogenes major paralogous domain-containing protein [Bacteroidales bacterium]|nr:fibrobacter succinogenes major paralogous domain-containing protein [Bacteroidales bacterium]
MANVETDKLDFTLDGLPDGDVHMLKDYRIPTPTPTTDYGKVPMNVDSTQFQWTRHAAMADATATASTESWAQSQGFGELSASLSDVAPHGLVKVQYSYRPTESFSLRFSGDNSYRAIKYRGAWLAASDAGIIQSGDTALLWFDGNVLQLIAVDRHERCDEMLDDGAYYPNAVQDADGNWYGAVVIGKQVWMAENLRTKHFSDGVAIPHGGTNYSDSTPYYYHVTGQEENDDEYGLLYNQPAVIRGGAMTDANPSGVQGVSPTGWHVPSGAEWNQLTEYLGKQNRLLADETTPLKVAKALAARSGWRTSENEDAVGNNQSLNNKTLFGAKPSGAMSVSASNNVVYDGLGYAHFATTSSYQTGSMAIRQLRPDIATLYVFGRSYSFSHHVRCVCDMTPLQFRAWYLSRYGSLQHHLGSQAGKTFFGNCNYSYDLAGGRMSLSEDIQDPWPANAMFLLTFDYDVQSGDSIYYAKDGSNYVALNLLYRNASIAGGMIKEGDTCMLQFNAGDLTLIMNDRWASIKTINGESLSGVGDIELGKGILTGTATSLTNTSANVTLNESGADLQHGVFLFIQFAVDMPALGRLNVANTVILNSDIIWKNATIPAGAIKSGDLCLFYYAYANGTNMSFLLYNSRWASLKTINGNSLSGVGDVSLAPPHTYYSTSMSTANATTAITCAANERAFHSVSVTAANTQLEVTLANSWDNVIFITGGYNMRLKIMIGGNTVPVYFERNSYFDGTNVNLSKAGTLKIVLEAVDGNVVADVDLIESYIPSS